jgi:hypothetical protein
MDTKIPVQFHDLPDDMDDLVGKVIGKVQDRIEEGFIEAVPSACATQPVSIRLGVGTYARLKDIAEAAGYAPARLLREIVEAAVFQMDFALQQEGVIVGESE